MCWYRLDIDKTENSFAEVDLGVLLDSRLTVRQQCDFLAKKANYVLGLRRRVARGLREVILPLFTPGEPCLECLGQCWAPMDKRYIDKLEHMQ